MIRYDGWSLILISLLKKEIMLVISSIANTAKQWKIDIQSVTMRYRVDVLHDLVPFVQFKKREKYPWRSVNFSKVTGLKPATLLKLTLLHGCFSSFLNCTNGTKSRNTSQMLDLWLILNTIRDKYLDQNLCHKKYSMKIW